MTAKPNQKGISVGTRGRFYLTNGSEITGKLVGVEPDQMKIELLEDQPPLLIPTTDVTSWEPLEESMPKTGIKKNLEAIEKQFGDKFQSAEIKLKEPDFKFPVNELSGSRETPMDTWNSIKDKYEFAKEDNVLTKEKKTDIISKLERLDDKFQSSASIKRHLAYFYALSEKWEDALKYYRESIILSQDGTGWYNLAVVAQETQKWELACYSLNQAFRRLPATEEQEAWYFYIKLLIKSDSHRDLSQVCQTEHREIAQDEAELLLETVVYLLKAGDWIEEAEEALKKSGEVSVFYLKKILNVFDKEPTKNYQKVARSFDKNMSNQINSEESQFNTVEGQSTPLASNAQTPIGNDYSEQLYLRASTARAEGHTELARQLFKQAIDASTTKPEAYEQLISIETPKSQVLKKDNLEKVRGIIQKAINAFPDHSNFYVISGHLERRHKEYQKAKDIFQKGIKKNSANLQLQKGLLQTLVEIDTEDSLREASLISKSLEKRGNIRDSWYHQFKLFQRNIRAKETDRFFHSAGMTVGIPGGQSNLPGQIADLVVGIDDQKQELKNLFDSFGLTGSFLVRCFGFNRSPFPNELKEFIDYLRDQDELVNLQSGGSRLLNPSLVFISVSEISNEIKNQIRREGINQAIVPLEKRHFQNNESPFETIHKQLVEYLSQRNLYNSTLPVSGRNFFGRERLLNELTDSVHNGEFLGIYGLRKIGKTSLVQHLRDEKLRDDAVAWVDLQALSTTKKNCSPLCHELECYLYDRLSNRNQELANLLRLGKIKLFSKLPYNDDEIRSIFYEDLKSLLNALANGRGSGINHLVIFLDELEEMLPRADQDQPGFDGYVEFFGLLRGLSQTYKGLLSSVVVAANAAISESGYWNGRDNPVYGLYKKIYLPPLSKEDCFEMIRELGKGMSVLWYDDAMSAVFDETSGHPFLTRSFCSRIVSENKNRPLQVTAQMVQDQISPFIREEGDKLQQITDMLKSHFPKELDFLHNIATAPELGEESNKMSDEALRHLLGYHLIVEENGEYRVTLNLLRRWIRREFDLPDE